MEEILPYCQSLSPVQIQQFEQLLPLYKDWNAKINVISRKDFDEFYTRHVLHSMAIAQVNTFLPNQKVLDVGTGGGFPGVPLAILFPETQFHLVDSIGKKINVVKDVAASLGLQNVTAEQIRAEQIKQKYHFVVSRAVTQMPEFVKWIRNKFEKNPLPQQQRANGLLYLKGGDLDLELQNFPQSVIFPISKFYKDTFFETKKVVYLPTTGM